MPETSILLTQKINQPLSELDLSSLLKQDRVCASQRQENNIQYFLPLLKFEANLVFVFCLKVDLSERPLQRPDLNTTKERINRQAECKKGCGAHFPYVCSHSQSAEQSAATAAQQVAASGMWSAAWLLGNTLPDGLACIPKKKIYIYIFCKNLAHPTQWSVCASQSKMLEI